MRRAIEYACQVNPTIKVIVRVHQASEFNLLSRFPRTQCVHGEMEIAYAMARHLLLASGVSTSDAELILDAARQT